MTDTPQILTVQERIAEIEARPGVNAYNICRKAGISPSTWSRWKRGAQPLIEPWVRALAAADALTLVRPAAPPKTPVEIRP